MQKGRSHLVGEGRKGDTLFRAEVFTPEEGSLHSWHIIKVTMTGNYTAGGKDVAAGLENSYEAAKDKALEALQEIVARENDTGPGGMN